MKLILSEPNVSYDHNRTPYLARHGLPIPGQCRYGSVRYPILRSNDKGLLFGQFWLPKEPKGTVGVIHGYHEHIGNYGKLISDFVEMGYAVAALDLRGHGLSEGPRGHLPHKDSYAQDLEDFFSIFVPQLLPDKPFYFWAHSLGGLIALQILYRGEISCKPSALVCTSPLLGFPELKGANRLLSKLSYLLSRVTPALTVDPNINPLILSHDADYLEKRSKDKLIIAVTTPGWFVNVNDILDEVLSSATQGRSQLVPTLMMLAGNEQVTNLARARAFATTALSTTTHKVIEFPHEFHELEKEPEVRARVTSETFAWLRSHPDNK